MSDHNHSGHGHEDGHVTHGAGHEMDVPPTKELFNIVWGLGALTLLSLATCVQLFNNQQQDIVAERGKESSAVLVQYRQGMDAVTKSAGEVSFKDSTGAEIKQRYVPLAVARELVLSKPERLLASPAPAGWMHPDDIAAGGAAPAGAPAGAPADGTVPGAVTPPTDPAAGTPAGAGTPADAGTPAGAPAGTPATGTPTDGSVPVAAPPAGTVAPAGAGTGSDAKAATPPAPAPAGAAAADTGKSGTPAPAPAHAH